MLRKGSSRKVPPDLERQDDMLLLSPSTANATENSAGSLVVHYTAEHTVLLTSPAFSRIPFQPYLLANDTSRPAFKAISHE
jgi:hypothetical protein